MSLVNNMYFVSKGERMGQFLAMIEFNEKEKNYSVLGLPESEPLFISDKDISVGLENEVLEFVEELPLDVFESCKNEFQHRIKVSNKQ